MPPSTILSCVEILRWLWLTLIIVAVNILYYYQVKHPSALNSFDSVMKAANGKKVVVFLDYDGTLSPIVEDPDKAFMSAEVANLYY